VSRLWTTTQDFAEGEQDNVDISNDEIKLPREQTFEYPWVWVTNYSDPTTTDGRGTISKIDARTHKEVARYAGPPIQFFDRSGCCFPHGCRSFRQCVGRVP
jgi:hypothetical protein